MFAQQIKEQHKKAAYKNDGNVHTSTASQKSLHQRRSSPTPAVANRTDLFNMATNKADHFVFQSDIKYIIHCNKLHSSHAASCE